VFKLPPSRLTPHSFLPRQYSHVPATDHSAASIVAFLLFVVWFLFLICRLSVAARKGVIGGQSWLAAVLQEGSAAFLAAVTFVPAQNRLGRQILVLGVWRTRCIEVVPDVV
jgi:hypothetical protein